MKNNKAFTLIELLVVMVIIGLVIMVIVPSVLKVMETNRIKEYQQYEKIVIEKTKLYVSKNQEDLIEPGVAKNFAIPYNILDIKSEGITCTGDIKVTYNKKSFIYKPLLECFNKSGKKISPTR